MALIWPNQDIDIRTINELLLLTQPAHSENPGKKLEGTFVARRAEFIRQRLNGIETFLVLPCGTLDALSDPVVIARLPKAWRSDVHQSLDPEHCHRTYRHSSMAKRLDMHLNQQPCFAISAMTTDHQSIQRVSAWQIV